MLRILCLRNSPLEETTDVKLSVLAEELNGKLHGPDRNAEVSGVSTIQDATPSQVCYYGNRKYRKYLSTTSALAVICDELQETSASNQIVVSSAYHAFRRVLEIFRDPTPSGFCGIHPTAVVHPDAQLADDVTAGPCAVVDSKAVIGERTVIGAGSTVGPGTQIGSECRINPGVSIYHDCVIGNRVIIHSGAVIGSDGFGFVPDPAGHKKIPQNGNVVIQDDVEIGAGCTIDRSVVGSTVIGRHTKLDNLVHLAHNVTMGPGCLIAAQTGIAGSTSVGTGVIMGGQVGVAGHVNVGDGVAVGAQSGISKSVAPNLRIAGHPARPQKEYLRINASLAGLPELRERVGRLERESGEKEEE
ncbi:MAG: UDP-3-O-(3-hydroxymyristoyl)glucosamine N-acyltransferase [Candidatus Aegiribacteria sp.]|nr:UDP-3-O-(3-hydroxymyristoyl)glucosamine N-acyltransferase [Candidatus Aegiribacteria sp.]MBD3295213.1 UDP-3-O-(3-hydroxymyristoyl)glucosamine N-acyltransferase [Candidatus Fermentibacteria bacterium]